MLFGIFNVYGENKEGRVTIQSLVKTDSEL